MAVTAHGLTDPGMHRTSNEDHILTDPDLGLYMIADGMRASGDGITASRIVTEHVRGTLGSSRHVLDRYRDDPSPENRGALERIVSDAVGEICGRLHLMSPEERKVRGAGTTLTLLGIFGSKAFVAHVGDSRIYLLRQDQFYLITEDHSLLHEYLKKGLITMDDPRVERLRKVLTRGIGLTENVQIDFQHFDVVQGDQFLLCSDGLHRYLSDIEEVRQIFATNDLDAVPATLVVLANSMGGEDNIGALVARIDDVGRVIDPKEPATDVKLQIALLEGIPLFSGLDYSELLTLHSLIKLHPVRTGQVVIAEEATGSELYVVLSGRLVVTRDGTELASLERGDHFGEIGLLGHGARTATVTSTHPGLLMSIDRDTFLELMRREPAMSVKVLWRFTETLARRLRRTNELLRSLGSDGELSIRFSRAPEDDEDVTHHTKA
jgi:serine/threonine protein phosphatase PrpC/CRP-like cAMP-binding protein